MGIAIFVGLLPLLSMYSYETDNFILCLNRVIYIVLSAEEAAMR
jgi:hypothetical protein